LRSNRWYCAATNVIAQQQKLSRGNSPTMAVSYEETSLFHRVREPKRRAEFARGEVHAHCALVTKTLQQFGEVTSSSLDTPIARTHDTCQDDY
jgi:hypothetical protein